MSGCCGGCGGEHTRQEEERAAEAQAQAEKTQSDAE